MGTDGDAVERSVGGRAAGGVSRGLTALQARFVEQYLLDGNATKAALRAGYSSRSAAALGSRALRTPQVQVALAERRMAAATQFEVDSVWVLCRLRVVVERCLQGVPVRERSGQETGEWSFNASGATRALELMGKHLGMFSERIDVQLLRSEVAQVAAELGLDEQAVMDEADRWLKTLRSR